MSSDSVTPVRSASFSWRKWGWRALSLLLAGALVAFMLSQVEWAAFVRVLGRLSPLSLVAAFLVYVLLNLFRSFRYIALLERELAVRHVFPIALYHNFLVRLLPFKLGELAYVVMMRERLDVSVKEGVSSLFGSRLLELLVIMLLTASSLLLSANVLPNQQGLALLLVVLSVGGGLAGFYYAGRLLRLGTAFLRWLRLPLVLRLCDRLDTLAAELDRLHEPRIFAKGLFWSLFTYGSSFTVNAILLHAIGLRVDVPALVLIVSLGMFATAFPFNISGFGAVELGWAFGLSTMAGYTVGEGTSIGLMLNGYQLICAALSGLLGYAVVQWQGGGKQKG